MALGGKRPNAGRPKGTKLPKTLEKEAVIAAFRQRVFKIANSLVTAQTSLAKGQQMIFRMDPQYETKFSKDGVERKVKTGLKKSKLVTDPDEIANYLDELEGAPGEIDDSYYFITTKEPNNQALDSLLDRALGRPKESLEVIDSRTLQVDF